jgi:cell shape-determining protein MreD
MIHNAIASAVAFFFGDNMGITAIILSIILYLVITIDHLRRKDYHQAMIWFGYSFANVGFLLAMLEKYSETP